MQFLKKVAANKVPQFFRSGFTLVETLVALAVLGMFFAAIALILHQIVTQVGESRIRTTALALGQSKMEIVRNLPYDMVGTSGGIPSGPLAQTETVRINNLDLTITTSVVFIDDPYDGVSPADTINTDYKRVRVEITWGGAYPSRKPVTLVTNIAPRGIETIVGGGTLRILVLNSLGDPIGGAPVQIDNTAVTPEIHLSTLTNNDGLVVLPGSPACVECYKISVTKSGYSKDRTFGTDEVTNPVLGHATVIEGDTTPITLAIDTVASIKINSYGSRESGYPPVANVLFKLQGSKIIGYDAVDNPVYKYVYATNTGGGTVTVPDLEWDNYILDLSDSFHNLAGANPILPLALAPGANLTVSIVAVPKTNTSLLITVKNAAAQLLASASARLTNAGLSYDMTKFTGATGSADFGQAYFGGLSPNSYDLKINLPGYVEATASLELIENHQEVFTLNYAE